MNVTDLGEVRAARASAEGWPELELGDHELRDAPDPPQWIEVDGDAEPTLVVEPRFRARQVAVRRAAERHRRRMLMAVLGAFLVVVGAVGSLFSPMFDVEVIEVSGAVHVARDDVVKASNIRLGDRLFSADLARASKRVSSLKWVKSARVERRWPDGILIRVRERAAVAVVQNSAGTNLLVTFDGWVAGVASGLDATLPVVTLAETDPQIGDHLDADRAAAVEMAAAIPESVSSRARSRVVTPAGEVIVDIEPAGQVFFGQPEDIRAKFFNADALLSGRVDLSGVCRVDLRSPSTPTVTRVPWCSS